MNSHKTEMPKPSLYTGALSCWVPWLVLLAGLIVTASATLSMKSSLERIARHEFLVQCGNVKTAIEDRLKDHAYFLMSGAAFVDACSILTRGKWHIFSEANRILEQLPGVQGFGFSILIPHDELGRHIQKIRKEGFPHYYVWPEGERDLYSSIIYLEPFSGRNLRAFGYDMFSEPVRRAAMERARDTNNASLSGKVVLVQETNIDVPPGTLMYVPVYSKGMPIDTIEQRRAAIYGWVYSPYRMKDLIQGIFIDKRLEKAKQLHFQIYDGENYSPEGLLYDSHPSGEQDVWFKEHFPINFNGKIWTLYFRQSGSSFSVVKDFRIWVILLGGSFIMLLIFVLIRIEIRYNAQVKQMVVKRTAELLIVTEQLDELNLTLEKKVEDEVEQNKLKDRLMAEQFHQLAIDELMINLAHQWRQPLNVIGMTAQDIEDDYRYKELTSETLNNSVKIIMDEVIKLSKTIKIFTDIYSQDEVKQEINISQAVLIGINFMKNQLVSNDVSIETNIEEDILAQGYFNIITQAIITIITNSIEVFIERKIENRHIKIDAVKDTKNGMVIITISDNGGGIEKEVIDKIFDPYITTKFKAWGKGMSLYLVKTMLERKMDGSMRIRNTVDGAEFIIEVCCYCG